MKFYDRENEQKELLRIRQLAYRCIAGRGEEGRERSYDVTYYNLDVIISVGYRVKSQRGVQFRQWATKRIHEYIVKGFTLDDEREKNNV